MLRYRIPAVVMLTCAMVATASAQTTKSSTAADPNAVYADFDRFCRQYFGAEKEPLVYEKFGEELQVAEDSSWRHVSENSACIAWQTNLPTRTHVEYGETDQYGGRTPETERFFYTHVHYLKDLKADATYHYRMVSTDERGNRVASPDATFETKKIAGALYIPGDVQGPPYILKEPNKTYVLKEDITAPGVAIAIFARGVALDLNGHTVTYNESPGITWSRATQPWVKIDEKLLDRKHVVTLTTRKEAPDQQPMVYGVGAAVGGFTDLKVLNGVIRQGAGRGSADDCTFGMNPIF
ncbi:MAG TPA: fibronectin type III domain-containing protein, partial [Planctomycetota bacterium]|nr:fibronectin type III domain-containing protein [Planctomycetota bacterium]